MPNDAISRRTFLSQAAAAGALCFHPSRSSAQVDRKQGAWWALVADPHINPSPDVSERGGQMDQRFRRVVRDILTGDPSVQGMIVNGDLAHREGRPEAYTRLLGLAYPVRHAGIDIQWVPGNHDNRENLLRAVYGARAPAFPVDGRYARVVERGGVRWFFLDSLIRPNHTPGELGDAQRAWLEMELDAHPQIPAVLVVHHNVDAEGGQLQDGRQFFKLVQGRRQVKAVIQGHNHTYDVHNVAGTCFIKLPATGYAFDPKQPIGWVKARMGPEGAELELRAVDGDRSQHGAVRTISWSV